MVSDHPVESLYVEHYPWLVSWLRQRTACRELARDPGQEVFLKLLLHELPERQYRALIMARVDGMSYREIAQG